MFSSEISAYREAEQKQQRKLELARRFCNEESLYSQLLASRQDNEWLRT